MNEILMVPDELIRYKQWVNWLFFIKLNRQPAIVPINPNTGTFASVSDPSSWGSFDIAIQRARTDRRVGGIGFVLTCEDPFVCVNFSHCRNPETGTIDPIVMAQIARLDSYTEVVIDGTGVHVIIKAALPEKGFRWASVEAYDRGRFFAFTGNHIPGFSTTINERQTEVNALRG